MAIWGALAKGAMGAAKGGAKKIAANKLLGRGKKKPQKPQAKEEKGGALAIRPTTSLVPTGPTGIVPSAGGALVTTGDGGSAGGGDSAEAIAVSISSKIVRVEKLLKGSALIKKDIRDDARKAREKASDKKQEEALEKAKPKDAKKGPKLNLPGKGLLSKVFGFFGAVILGRIAMLVFDWLPTITPFLKKLGAFVDGALEWGGKILNGLTGFIDWSYKLYDAATGWIKEQLGEEGAEKFDTFMGNLKKLIQAFLVWKIIGEKIFKGIVSAIKNVWKTVTKAIRTIWVKLRRLVGRHVRKFFGNLVKRAGGALKAAGQGIWNVTKGIGSKVGGLFSKGAGAVAKTGAGKAVAKVGGWAAKIFGKAAGVVAPALKAATPAVKGFARRIPILGPIIVAIVSLMSGEGIGQALFKSVGAALGGALGTFIPIPILGTLIGETIGMFVGDLLYYTIIERNPKKAFGMLKGAFTKILSAGRAVFDWVTGGFGRFYEGIPKIKIPDLPEEPPGWIPGFGFGSKKKIWGAFKTGLKVLIGPLSLLMGKELPNLLWLMNPLNNGKLLIKSFFPPGGKESGGKSASPASVGKGGDDKPSGLDKQEKALISANQKKGYEGVMEQIESYAPYEDKSSTTIKVSTPPKSPIPSISDSGSSQVISVGGGRGGDDPFEVLDAFG